MRLDKLAPEWVSIEGEWAAGVSFSCPRSHVRPHRHTVLFEAGAGSRRISEDSSARWVSGSSFSSLTLAPPPFSLGPCGLWRLKNGILTRVPAPTST